MCSNSGGRKARTPKAAGATTSESNTLLSSETAFSNSNSRKLPKFQQKRHAIKPRNRNSSFSSLRSRRMKVSRENWRAALMAKPKSLRAVSSMTPLWEGTRKNQAQSDVQHRATQQQLTQSEGPLKHRFQDFSKGHRSVRRFSMRDLKFQEISNPPAV